MDKAERNQLIVDEYQKVYSMQKVANIVGVSLGTVKTVLKKLNVDTNRNSNKSARYDASKYRFKQFDKDLFKTLDRHSAYLLGLLFADGTIYTIKKYMQLRLKLSDLDFLEKVRAKFFPEHTLVDGATTEGFKKSEIIIVCNNEICETLISRGLKPRKTYSSHFPQIEDELLPHFVRGFFDGNGCISYYVDKRSNWKCYEMVLISTDDFICKLLYKLSLLGLSAKYFYDKKHDSRIGKLRIREIQSLITFYELMYSDLTGNDLFLERKYIKYKEFIDHYDNY